LCKRTLRERTLRERRLRERRLPGKDRGCPKFAVKAWM
jgi:hypothetical protein